MKTLFFVFATAVIFLFNPCSSVHAEASDPPYDLNGKWIFRGMDIQGSFCDGSYSRDEIELEISIQQTGDQITIILFEDEIYQGRTSNYFIGAENDEPSAITVISGKVSEDADTIYGALVFLDKNDCPDAEVGYAEYVLYRASSLEKYPFRYYLPLYSSISVYRTGIGLSNLNESESADVLIRSFDSSGNPAGTLELAIPPDGQKAEVLDYKKSFKGWTLVESTHPLAGLCFWTATGMGTDNYMADIPITDLKSSLLQIPHVAYSDLWDTTIYIANPNDVSQNVFIEVLDQSGLQVAQTNENIGAMGGGEYQLSAILKDVFLGSEGLKSGKVKLSAGEGIVAFALYDNLKDGKRSFAGINAVDPYTLRIPKNDNAFPF